MLDKTTELPIVYLRTDLGAHDLQAGGSVAHTLGVVEGFLGLGKKVICVSSAMVPLLCALPFAVFCDLKMPRALVWMGFRLNCLASNFFFTLKSLWLLRRTKISFVYQRYSLLNGTGVFVALCKRVPLVLEFNGSEVWMDTYWVNKKWMRFHFLIRYFEHLNLRRAHSIIVVSQVLKDDLVTQGFDANKIVVNPNGVDTQKFNPAVLREERMTIRDRLGLQDCFVFGFVGSFSAWHGIETIAQMVPAVYRVCPHVHFLLIGSGPLQGWLQGELEKAGIGSDVVTLLGTVPQAQAKNYLAACDAFLSPTKSNQDGSRFFGSPTKMFEYMSLGKPIIASDLEQLSELLFPALRMDVVRESCENKIGILVPANDVQGFIHAAVALVKMSGSNRKMLGNNARTKVIEKFSWKDHTKKIIQSIYAD